MKIEKQSPEITLSEDEIYNEVVVVEESRQFVVFRIADEWYALPIKYVKEVVPASSYAPPA